MVRAGVVVTGTEVLTGRVTDANGPWLADRLLELGVELAHTTICGDRPEDMEAQLRFLSDQGVDLIVTSGGLGPTADDLTLEVVAGFTGRPLALDQALEQRITAIVEPLMRRWPNVDLEAVRTATRKQALVPQGATVIEPAGTAPGMVVPGSPTIVVMPGPPRELQSMWPQAVASEPFRAVVADAPDYSESMLRLFGIPESEIAETLRVAEGQVEGLDRLEVTTCLRRGEVEVVVRHEPAGQAAWEALAALVADRHGDTLFSTDGSSIDDQVAELLEGHTIATAESCTGGLLAARLTERPGSSAYVNGGSVTYANEAKTGLLGVDPALIEAHGAVSPEVAAAMAGGALERHGVDLAVAITGIAGPDGGSAEKPVGTVCWCVRHADGGKLARNVRVPGGRVEVRDRSTTVAMHMLREFLGARTRGLSHDQSWRLFLALELPPPTRSALAGWTADAVGGREGLRAVPEPSLHVTVVFLGSTPATEVAAIWRAAAAALPATAAPELAGAGLVALPRRRPRVFALGLEDRGGRAAALQRAVAGALDTDAERPWLAHVTLARVRKGHRVAHLATDPPAVEPFAAPALTLLRSHPGSRYELLERVELRALIRNARYPERPIPLARCPDRLRGDRHGTAGEGRQGPRRRAEYGDQADPEGLRRGLHHEDGRRGLQGEGRGHPDRRHVAGPRAGRGRPAPGPDRRDLRPGVLG